MPQKRWPSWASAAVLLASLALVITGAINFVVPLDRPSSTIISSSRSGSAPGLISPTFDGELAYRHVLAQTEIGPRPTGSAAGWATGDFIIAELERQGWPVETQEFIFKGVQGRNIIARQGRGPLIILGTHYDTRPAADRDPDPTRRSTWIDGANDGASGVAVLLELARVLDPNTFKNEIWLTFFDAEDRGFLEGWPFFVGSRTMARHLTSEPETVIIVDMVGDADQLIYFEHNSTQALQREIWRVAEGLGYKSHFIPEYKHLVFDDHIPFLERGIPAANIIDFDYPYWHTTADTADKVSPASLERVGRTIEIWLRQRR